ncbi:programmed cell death protein 4 [Fagus crenata]
MASNEGFLTNEQREMLKIASQNVESLSSSPKSPTSLLSEYCIKAPAAGGGSKAANAGIAVKHVRRSHSGRLGRAKKDGAGGKGTWGKLLDTDGESHLDRNDPNYDSGEEPYQLVGSTVSDPLDEYKKAVVSIVEEYFSTGDVELAASDLRELGSSGYLPYFIKRLVSMAMDRHDKEKEMASVLLSALYADVISPNQIQDGFFMLLESADDLAVDILDAVDILALFLARAVVDDIIPPAFLTGQRKHSKNLPRSSGSEEKIADLLREYVESGDTVEACCEEGFSTCYGDPNGRTTNIEAIKEAAEEGLISSSQMVKGFSRLAESLDDLALDIPSAKTLFQSLVPKAISEGWLDASFAKSSVEDGEVPDDAKVRRFKEEAVTIIHEYFLSDDIPELIQSLVDLAEEQRKEMASVLLSSLHSEIFSSEDIANGFLMLLESAEDTALDILDASNELALFLARAVIDDVLVPHNLEEMSCNCH